MGELLERGSFVDSLCGYGDEAGHGQGRLVLLSGEAGVGKTELLEHAQTRMPQARWLWGRCDALTTPRPLGPLRDIATEVGGELLRVIQDGAPRDALFECLLTELGAQPGRTVFVVEDIHWADEATLDLLRFLWPRLSAQRVLLVATYREDAFEVDDSLRQLLGDAASFRGTRRMRLPALSPDAVGKLAAGSRYSADQLYALTGGNPFFLSQVLANDDDALPPSARDAVLARAARLDPVARAALDAAAVAGARVEPSLLLALSMVSADGIDACVAAGLLVSDAAVLRFRHDIARHAVEESVTPLRRAAIHRDVLDRLLVAGDADPARIAHHADGAGDAARVLEYSPLAAVRASEMGAHREAASHYQRALRFAAGCGHEEMGRLYDSLADETAMVDRWEASVDARLLARDHWHEAGNLLRVGQDLRELSAGMWRLCRGPESRRFAYEAVAVLEQLPVSAELAKAWLTVSGYVFDDDPDEGIAYTQKAQAVAREFGLAPLLSDALNSAGYLEFYRGGDGAPQLREALEVAKATDTEVQIARSYANLHEVLTTTRRFAEVESVYRVGLAYCEERDIPTYTTCVQGRRTIALGIQGRAREGYDLAMQLLAGEFPSPVNRLTSLTSAGLLGARMGEPDTWRWLDEAWELAVGVDEADWPVLVGAARTEVLVLEGDEHRALEEASRALPWAPRAEPWRRGELAIWLHRLGGRADRDGIAAPYLVEMDGLHEQAAAQWERLVSPYDAAMALLFSGKPELMREAITRLDPLRVPAAEALARRRLQASGASVPAGRRATTRANLAGLTQREQQVLNLLAQNYTNAQIAHQLVLSERTVDHHVSTVLRKLDVRSRRDALDRARELGLTLSET